MDTYFKDSIYKGSQIAFIVLTLLSISHSVFSASILSYTSSTQSTIGGGDSLYVTKENGYLFSVDNSIYFDSSQHFRVASPNSPFGPNYDPLSGEPWNQWRLHIAAPNLSQLEPGFYDNATRWPFQDIDEPGFNFTENSIGHNNSSGSFLIHEIDFDNSGIVSKLALDFTFYEENDLNRFGVHLDLIQKYLLLFLYQARFCYSYRACLV